METTTFVPIPSALRRTPVLLARVAGAACAGAVAAALVGSTPATAQELTFEEYEPRSTLVVPEHPVTRARLPFIDVHSHHRRLTPERVDWVVAAMDRLNMAALVNLSGGSGEELAERVRLTAGRHPGRFVTFANLDFDGIGEPGWGERAARQLEAHVAGLGRDDRPTAVCGYLEFLGHRVAGAAG